MIANDIPTRMSSDAIDIVAILFNFDLLALLFFTNCPSLCLHDLYFVKAISF